MEDVLYFILGFIAVALGLDARFKRRVERGEERLDRFARRIDLLEERLVKLTKRVEQIVPQKSGVVEPSAVSKKEPTVAPQPVTLQARVEPPPVPVGLKAARAETVEKPKQGVDSVVSKASTARPSIDWEQFMGVRLFAWLGGFALFLAAAFFVKYSFDHNLISPALRVTIGFVVGLGALAGGSAIPRQTYRVTANTLSAVGVVVLYTVTFASHAVYAFPLFGVTTTFLLMSVITVVAFSLAVHQEARVIAVLGMLGGFLTPLLVSSDAGSALALFGYIALLDVGLAAVAVIRRWDRLHLGGVLGTVLFQFLWVVEQYDAERVGTAMAVFLGFGLLYLGVSVTAWRRGSLNLWLAGAAVVPSMSTLLFVLTQLNTPVIATQPGVLYTFLLGADLSLLALSVLNARLRNVPVLGGGLTFFILSVWIGRMANDDLLYWALAGVVGFTVLYTGFPVVAHRKWPGVRVSPLNHLMPTVGLLVMIVPMLKFATQSFAVWPFATLLMGLGFGIAAATASLLALALSLAVTVGLGLFWLLSLPAVGVSVGQALTVMVGMVFVFQGGLLVVLRSVKHGKREGKLGQFAGLGGKELNSKIESQLPALSAIAPFVLLVLLTARLPLESATPVFGVGLLMGGVVLGLEKLLRLDWLPPVGLLCTALLQATWLADGVSSSTALSTLMWNVVFGSVYSLYPFLFLTKDSSRWLTWVTAAVSGPVHFLLIYSLVGSYWPNDFMGIIPLIFVIPSLLGLYLLKGGFSADDTKRNTVLAWWGGVALQFVTLIFPIQFDREWLTIGWAFEGAALLWLVLRIPHPGLRYTGVVLMALAFIRLTLNSNVLAYFPRSEYPLFNGFLYTYGCVAAAFFTAARWFVPGQVRIKGYPLKGLLYGLGTILVFCLLNIEIADFFALPGQGMVSFESRGNLAQDLAYTIVWAAFALGLVLVGIVQRAKGVRLAGIGLMGVTLLKLFFNDLSSLSQLYRVGALAGVAVMAMVASVLYQRFFRDRSSIPENRER